MYAHCCTAFACVQSKRLTGMWFMIHTEISAQSAPQGTQSRLSGWQWPQRRRLVVVAFSFALFHKRVANTEHRTEARLRCARDKRGPTYVSLHRCIYTHTQICSVQTHVSRCGRYKWTVYKCALERTLRSHCVVVFAFYLWRTKLMNRLAEHKNCVAGQE